MQNYELVVPGLRRPSAALPSDTVMLTHSCYAQPGQNDQDFFDVSPDGHHLAVTVESVLQPNIGMVENTH